LYIVLTRSHPPTYNDVLATSGSGYPSLVDWADATYTCVSIFATVATR